MRFYSFINEKVDFEKIKEILLKNCKPVLKDLYRDKAKLSHLPLSGRKIQMNQDIKIRKVRKNRKPKDTPIEVHDYIDDYFYKKHGEYFRSNSIFATGKWATAEYYGTPFMILPVGKYKVLWSYAVKDLYKKLFDMEEYQNCIEFLAPGHPSSWIADEDEIWEEWENLYDEGKIGSWKFGDIEVNCINGYYDKEDAALIIIKDLGFKEDYDVDEKEEILDIVSNMKKYIKKLQGQKTLFGEDEEIEKLIFDGEIKATLYSPGNGEYYYIKDKNFNTVKNKHSDWKFIDKESAWLNYKRYLIKQAVVERGIPLPLDLLNAYWDEKWASDILDAFDAKHKIIYVDDLISYIEDEIEWVPEISFEEFLEDHPVKDYSYCEDLIYEILDSYETGNIVRAIESEKEIMISCDKYILIKDVNDVGDKIVEWIKSGMKL